MSQSVIFNWILAARPKTLLAAFSPVAIGTTLAAHDGGFHFLGMLGALLSAISVQIGTNFCNDYCDFFQGADTEARKGPTRAVQSGLISPRAMLIATITMFALTALFAALVSLRAGWPFLVLGGFSILFGVLYTAGRYSLAYTGIADPFVLFFFGPVAVAGTHYIQTLAFDWSTVIAGFGPGLLATGLLVVNNLRDIDEDRDADKRTLAVRFGATFSRLQYTGCIVGSSLVPIALVSMKEPRQWGVCLASLVLVPGVLVAVKVWRNNGTELRPCLGMTAGLLLIFTVLLCVGLSL
ncbi:MAG: 1,4-dihydroxy-2-naphthoate polyprenyltransferase [Planctomycetota bacterium]